MSDEPRVAAPATTESAPPSKPPEYEFTTAQNKVFSDLAENLSFAGWFVIVVIVVFHAVLVGRWIINGIPPYEKFRLSYVVWPLLLVFCSAQFIRTAKAFRKVVDTQGSDVSHLMTGLENLNTAFTWLTIVPRIWILFAFIALIIGAILGVVHLLGY